MSKRTRKKNEYVGPFQREIERIKAQYALYDKQLLNQTVWAPFSAVEMSYRCQQQSTFAFLMRQIGRADLAGLRILDVGCGTGRILRTYLDMGCKPKNLYGVDINEDWLAEGRRISPQLNLLCIDGTKLDFSNATFDLVTQYVVFSSIALQELRQQVAGEMWRVLKPGGYVFWWDMPHLSAAAGGHAEPLDYRMLFPDAPRREIPVGPSPKPSETLRGFRGVRLLAPLINRLGKPATHIAALIGPKV